MTSVRAKLRPKCNEHLHRAFAGAWRKVEHVVLLLDSHPLLLDSHLLRVLRHTPPGCWESRTFFEQNHWIPPCSPEVTRSCTSQTSSPPYRRQRNRSSTSRYSS